MNQVMRQIAADCAAWLGMGLMFGAIAAFIGIWILGAITLGKYIIW